MRNKYGDLGYLQRCSYLEIVPLGVALAAESAGVPLAVVDVGVNVLARVFLEVALLREALPAPLARERPHSLVHAHVVEQVPRLEQRLVAPFVPALVLRGRLLFAEVVEGHRLVLAAGQQLQAELFVGLGRLEET